jgi:hypothetical protein
MSKFIPVLSQKQKAAKKRKKKSPWKKDFILSHKAEIERLARKKEKKDKE